MRRSGLLGLIGNPRYSTFAHLQGDNAAADDAARRRMQRVTVSYDYIHPPVLAVRFSQLEFPQMERAIAYAAASASAGPITMPTQQSRTPSGRGEPSPGMSVRANASLYRQRPEYFTDVVQLPPPAHLSRSQSQNVVTRPDSPTFGRESAFVADNTDTPPGLKSAAAPLRRPSLAQTKERSRETVNSRSGEGEGGESYDTVGILSQFPDTPTTTPARGRRVAAHDSFLPLPTPPTARRRSSESGADPFLDMTPSDGTPVGNGNVSGGSSTGVVAVASRARIMPVRFPTDEDSPSPSHRDSFLNLSDGGHSSAAPSPFDPTPSTSTEDQPDVASYSHRRIDMRHQRVPTADLAPLNVFRERLAEQRRARSSHSGSASTGGASMTLSASVSPQPEPMPRPQPRAASQSQTGTSGRDRRDTVASSVASFFIGPGPHEGGTQPPAVPDRSHWSSTNDSTAITGDGDDGDSILMPPSMTAISTVNSERTTPSPTAVPHEIQSAEQRGSVVFDVAR